MPMTPTPAAAGPVPTLAEVMRCIADDPALPPARRRSLPALLRCAARLLGESPERLRVDAGLARGLRHVRPARHRVGEGHLANVRAAVRAAMRHAGVEIVPGRDGMPPSPAWQALLAGVEGRGAHLVLTRAARWLTGLGVGPGEVAADTLARYHAALEAGSARKETSRRFAEAWNAATAAAPGWPRVTLPLVRYPNRWTIPLEELPEPLRGEIAAFLARAADPDPFLGGPGLRPPSPATVRGWRYRLRAYVSALAEAGLPLPASLRDIVGVETAKAGLRRLLARSPSGSRDRAFQVAHLLGIIARDHLRCGPEHVEALADLGRRLAAPRDGLTTKNRGRLAPFDDGRLLRDLAALPERLMRRAEAADDGSRRPALLAQTAVAVELLLMAPLRGGNLLRLRLDRHLALGAGRDGPARLAIPGEEVKNRRPLDFPLPAETRRLLLRYRDRFLPRLAAAPGAPWLFPGRDGTGPKCWATLGGQITRALGDELGVEVHPHLFRHLAAKIHLEHHPGEYETVRRLLGHASLQTTTAFYAGTEMAAAVRHYDRTVLRLREAPAPAAGKRRAGGRR